MNAAPQQQSVPDSTSTTAVPTPPIVVPPPESHHLTGQPPQNFSLPTAPSFQSAVASESAPQMQPVIPQASSTSTSQTSSSETEQMPPLSPTFPIPPTNVPQESYVPPTSTSYTPPKKRIPIKTVLALILAFVTILGGGAAYYLSQNSADLRQRAASDVYPPPPTAPPTAPPTPPSGTTACSRGEFSCGGYGPAECSSHGGQGCYYHAQSFSCKCGNGGGGGDGTGPSASCGGGKAHLCGGSTGATFCVASCSQNGNYSGNSCNYGCNSNCTDVNVSANTCTDVGPGTSSCGRWQVDVHGAASCADSGCSNSGCTTPPTTPPTAPPTAPPPSVLPSASVGIGQPNCVNVPGKYQAGSAISFTGSGATTNRRTLLFLAKVNAAGNGLDSNFNSSCPVGEKGEGSAYFCKVYLGGDTNSPTASWAAPTAGKYVIVSNGYTDTAACSGNPTCSVNAGAGNPMTIPGNCPAAWTSCSDNDYKFFEVIGAEQCTTAATPPSASVGISQANCSAAPKLYQAGSPITFTGTGPATNTKTYLFLAKVNAAGTGLDPNFNSNCPIGVRGEGSAHFCKISTTENNNPSAVWNTPQPGKYVIVSNGYTAAAACSGNPTCTYNAGLGNPMTPVTCAGNFISCSENDYKFFEVAIVESCTTPVCTYNPNIDGKNGVDIDDYVLFVQNVMKVGKNIPGDVDCSGRVDLDDYPYIVRNFSIQ